jgi:ATP-dependent DNA ligase
VARAFGTQPTSGDEFPPLTACPPRIVGGEAHRVGIVLSSHTDQDGATLFVQACRMGLEGIVSKRLSAPYRSGPSRDWIKVKNPDSPAMIRAREADR